MAVYITMAIIVFGEGTKMQPPVYYRQQEERRERTQALKEISPELLLELVGFKAD